MKRAPNDMCNRPFTMQPRHAHRPPSPCNHDMHHVRGSWADMSQLVSFK